MEQGEPERLFVAASSFEDDVSVWREKGEEFGVGLRSVGELFEFREARDIEGLGADIDAEIDKGGWSDRVHVMGMDGVSE